MRHLLLALILLSPLFSSGQRNTSNPQSNPNIRVRISDSIPNISKIAVIGKESELCNGNLDDGQGLAEVVEGELLGIYGVVERNHLEDVLDEQRLAMGGLLLKDSDFAKAGCLAGAQGTVLVSYGCLQRKTKIQVKLVDCSTSDMYWSATGFNVSEFELLDELRYRLLDKDTSKTVDTAAAELGEDEQKKERLEMVPSRDSIPISEVVKSFSKERKNFFYASYMIGAGDTYTEALNGSRYADHGFCIGYSRIIKRKWQFYTDFSYSEHRYSDIRWPNTFDFGYARVSGVFGSSGLRLILGKKKRVSIGAGFYAGEYAQEYTKYHSPEDGSDLEIEKDFSWFTAAGFESSLQVMIPLTRNKRLRLYSDVLWRYPLWQIIGRFGLAFQI